MASFPVRPILHLQPPLPREELICRQVDWKDYLSPRVSLFLTRARARPLRNISDGVSIRRYCAPAGFLFLCVCIIYIEREEEARRDFCSLALIEISELLFQRGVSLDNHYGRPHPPLSRVDIGFLRACIYIRVVWVSRSAMFLIEILRKLFLTRWKM